MTISTLAYAALESTITELKAISQIKLLTRVKSGNFEHHVKSDINLQTVRIQMSYEPSHQDFHCLLSIFHCLLSIFFTPIINI